MENVGSEAAASSLSGDAIANIYISQCDREKNCSFCATICIISNIVFKTTTWVWNLAVKISKAQSKHSRNYLVTTETARPSQPISYSPEAILEQMNAPGGKLLPY